MKPDDIPQGIWDAAEVALDDPVFDEVSYISFDKDLRMKTSIARAIMVEREACAEISDRYVKRDGVDAWARGYRCAGAGISQEIRSRP